MERDSPQSLDEALHLVDTVRRLVERARRTPGLLEGHAGRLRREVERLIDASSRPTRGKHRELLRGANEIAAELVDLRKSGGLAAKFVRVLDRSLLKLRKRDFGRSHDALRLLDRPLALVREIDESVTKYRQFYSRIAKESEDLRGEITRLEAVPRPDRSPEDCADAKRRLRDLQQAIDFAYSFWIHESPARQSFPLLLDLAGHPDSVIPAASEPGSLARLLEYLQEPAPATGVQQATVWQLREWSGYTDAKFGYVVGDDPRARSVLRENAPWLAALCATGATAFRFRTLESLRQEHFTALRRLLDRSADGRQLAADVAALVSSKEWEILLRSSQLYERYGDLARKRWDNRLAVEIQELRGRQEASARDLAALPPPDRLTSS